MTYAAALTRLETWTFTGLKGNLGAVDFPPEAADLPALVTEPVSQPFVEGFGAAVVGWDAGNLTVFVDHVLLVQGWGAGTFNERWANLITYVDRYLACAAADLDLNGNLVEPLALVVVDRGLVLVRNRAYSGVRFRHRWKIRY